MDVIVKPTIFETLEQRLFLLLGPQGVRRFQGRSADVIQKALLASCVGQVRHSTGAAAQRPEDLPLLESEVTVFDDPLPGMSSDSVDGDILAAYLTLRVVWLTEIVFSDQDLAMNWLCQKKTRLQNHAPLALAAFPAHAAALEQWLLEIDEGSGL